MANQVTGAILAKQPAETITAKSGQQYTKQTLLLDCTRYDPYSGERSKYENILPLDFFGDIATQLQQYNVGDIVSVEFYLDGHEFTDRTGQPRRTINVRPSKITLVRNSTAALAQQIAAQQGYQQVPQGYQSAPAPQQAQQQPADTLPF